MTALAALAPLWAWYVIVSLTFGCFALATQVDWLERRTPAFTLFVRLLVVAICIVIGWSLLAGLILANWLHRRDLYVPTTSRRRA